MLALMVLCFVIIDLILLVVFSLAEGLQGNLTAERVVDKEHSSTTTGVGAYVLLLFLHELYVYKSVADAGIQKGGFQFVA